MAKTPNLLSNKLSFAAGTSRDAKWITYPITSLDAALNNTTYVPKTATITGLRLYVKAYQESVMANVYIKYGLGTSSSINKYLHGSSSGDGTKVPPATSGTEFPSGGVDITDCLASRTSPFSITKSHGDYLSFRFISGNYLGKTYFVNSIILEITYDNYYTITVAPNDTSFGSVSGGGSYKENTTATFTASPSLGYYVENWMKNGVIVEGAGGLTVYNATVNGNNSYIAVFAPIKYKIVFDGNGATGGSTAAINTQYDKTEYLPNCGFAKEGYRFDRWEGGVGYKKAGDPVSNLCYTNNATYTFYATWNPNIFSIRYNPNGASGAPVIQNEQQTDFVNIVFNSNPYTRDGYTFINWNTKPDGSGTSFTPNTLEPNIFKPEHNSIIDVYAQWNPNSYTIHFSANGGIGSMSELSMVYDTSKNLIANTFTKAGHTFNGWNTAADGSGTHYDDGASVVNLATDGTKILYAEWAINQYTITWKDWDGSELEKKKWNYNTIPSYSGDTDSLSYETEDAFHDFDGWAPNIQKVTADATYTATYLTTTKTYTVIWKNADGQELERDDNVPHGSEPKYDGDIPTLQSDDPKYYYVFNNWDAALKPVTNNITYTATYTKNIYKYTVIWNDWDGTELEKDVDVVYDTPPSYDKENPVRESTPQTEYIFIGWKTEINETPIEEDDLSAVRGDITYTAVYEARDRMYDFSVVISPSEECGYVTGYTDSAYKYGSELTLVAVPYDGYQFVSWYYTVNGIPQTLKNNQLELSIFEDTEITAIFEEKPNTPLYINETQVDSVYVNPDTLTITYVVSDGEIILPSLEHTFLSVDGWSFLVSNDIPSDVYKIKSIYINEVQIY